MNIDGEEKRILVAKGAASEISDHLRHYMKDKPVTIIDTEATMQELLDMVETEVYELLVLDIYIPEGDGLSLLEQLRARNNDTRVVMYTGLCTHTMIQAAFELDIDYYFVQGDSILFVADMLWRIVSYYEYVSHLPLEITEITAVTINVREALERDITDMIRQFGIPANIKGYHYLREAILLAVQDVSNIQYITKQLYPVVAEKYHTNSGSVERAIRHAITLGCQRGNQAIFREYFGQKEGELLGKPSNSQFIALTSDRLRMEYGMDVAVS